MDSAAAMELVGVLVPVPVLVAVLVAVLVDALLSMVVEALPVYHAARLGRRHLARYCR